jgi:uncharacterized protein YjbJ (UPF0337 family)
MSTNSATGDKLAGAAHQAKGAIKDNVGAALGNEKMQVEGKVERAEGKAQSKVRALVFAMLCHH